MKIVPAIILVLFFSHANAQFPYVKRIGFPEQLPTQVVYDMHIDTKGYIWLATDKGVYRFNGRSFISVPFENTSSKAVSYLSEDDKGVIWCMNFYNQVFSIQKDTLRRFDIDYRTIKGLPTFLNLVVGSKQLWLQSYGNIYEFDKATRKILTTIPVQHTLDQIISTVVNEDDFYAITNHGFLFSRSKKEKPWRSTGHIAYDFKFIPRSKGLIGIGAGSDRSNPFEIIDNRFTSYPPVKLPPDIAIFHGVYISDEEYWLCTQSGAYLWNKKTGETQCYFPNQRISDLVKDYQGNYWFSTLDEGVFICTSLSNSLQKLYQDPLLDNFTRLQILPNHEVVAGNTLGLMAKINLQDNSVLKYNLVKRREMEFIRFDTVANVIISNRGVFKQDQQEPFELIDLGKGVERDKFGNLLVTVFNQAFVMNDHFNSPDRLPAQNCPLYQRKLEVIKYDGKYWAFMLRGRRSISVLASRDKQGFWIGYEDDLYEYLYDGTIRKLKDQNGNPVVAKSMQQLWDGSLVVGSSTKGVLFFKNGKPIRTFNEKNGLSSVFIRKVLIQNQSIWVLTDAGLDRIDAQTGVVTNCLEEYGLSNTIVNDFVIDGSRILFATTSGILVCHSLLRSFNFEIRFPLLKAISEGVEIHDSATLHGKDIVFNFEALHYLSTTALSYQYHLKGLDTVWRTANSFSNQLAFNRLNPGKYTFEIKAVAGPDYRSVVKRFSFTVPRPYWQKTWFFIIALVALAGLLWLILLQWKKSLLGRQRIKEQLLKSQLVALRAQMNPHFLYNVLNTVQGLVYGNRKTEAGELLGNFSDLMRKTLQASDKQLLPLKDEIENLRLYLELEKARFDDGFSYQIEIVDIDDLSTIYIPSLMLQPFAENAVKHGLMHKQGNKEVMIRFEKEADGLRVIIDDNGIGRIHSMEINQRSKGKPFSFATIALNERIDLFNLLYKQKITCRIVDKIDKNQQSQGTRIELFIPDYSNDPHAL